MLQKDFSSIPVVDMNAYLNGSQDDKQAFVRQVHDACKDVGFFYLKNHPVHPDLIKKILRLTQMFFDLPQAEKDSLDISQSSYFRGYGRLLAEKTHGVGDYKETYDLGLETAPHPEREKQRHLRLIGPNQWPSSATLAELAFKETITTYIKQMMALGSELMKVITASLNYPVSRYTDNFQIDGADAYTLLRLLHYPASKEQKLGVGEHVDAGFIALLLQDEVGGLQVKNRAQQWVDVPPLANHFIVNIGQMLQSWSQQYYVATPHRVLNHAERNRISAPFFFEPNLSTPIHLGDGMGQAVIYGEYMLAIFERSFPVGASQ